MLGHLMAFTAMNRNSRHMAEQNMAVKNHKASEYT